MWFPTYQKVLVVALPFLGGIVADLNPSCRPGGNFDLSKWVLETPIDNGKKEPLQVSGAQLSAGKDGCKNGWEDKGSEHQWFFTLASWLTTVVGPHQNPKDGSMVMKAPGYSVARPCIKWKESSHCRTEFHESSPASWSPGAATNRLHVKLVRIRGGNVCIGQVFQVGGSARKPFAELYYRGTDGTVIMGVATCPGGKNDHCSQDMQPLGKVPLNTTFTYDIIFEGHVLKAGINGDLKTLRTHFSTPGASFKVGNYNQGTDDASLHIWELVAQHVRTESLDL